MPQTLAGSVDVTTLEGAKQTISMGPMASQEIIKELGTNGGGFMNANSAHPFENPNAWTNILEIWALLLIPVASVLAFGRAVGDFKQGRAILVAMAILLVVGIGVVYWAESAGTLGVTALGVDPSAGNLEGKELRFGQALSVDVRHGDDRDQHRRGQRDARFADAARRPRAAVQPAGRLHLAGRRRRGALRLSRRRGHRRVHRRADGRPHARISRQEDRIARNEARDVRGADLSARGARLLRGFGAAADRARQPRTTAGPHGLSEIIYAYASANANNGSAFAGLNGNTPWFNTTLGIVMLSGRFAYVIPVLALAGGLAAKKKAPPSAGTFPTTGPLFVGLLIGVIVILYLLQYFPALALGPVVEHFLMLGGKAF